MEKPKVKLHTVPTDLVSFVMNQATRSKARLERTEIMAFQPRLDHVTCRACSISLRMGHGRMLRRRTFPFQHVACVDDKQSLIVTHGEFVCVAAFF